MIVDADLAVAVALAEILRSQGYTAEAVHSAEAALAVLRRDGESPSVALIDVRLGGVSHGVDLIPRLHAQEPGLVCALLTTEFDNDVGFLALRRGAYDYVDKSATPDALLRVLDRCFDHVAAQRDREMAFAALYRAKEEAEAASRGKSGFLATMSHELRTPLNAIIGFSEMMMREVLGPLVNEQYRAYIGNIHDSGTHLLRIINDILDISKAEAGKLDLFEDVFDLRETIQSVRQLVSARITEGGLSEAVNLPSSFPLLRADERKTKQVLLNLVANAIKFSKPGGRIEITGQFDPINGVQVMVSDSGIGIAAADLARVLEPFEQVDSTFSRSHQGTGLGLPLVKAIMELHGGNLELHSELGVGTRARVIFPPGRAVTDQGAERARNAA